jgi:MFS family permease
VSGTSADIRSPDVAEGAVRTDGAGAFGRVLAARRRLPENVRTVGLISLANDSASELAYPILPLFLTLTLGAPILAVGLVEGIPEAVSTVVKFFSGWLSDLVGGRRRPWIVVGYVLSTFARIATAAAATWHGVLGARVVDRVGKGVRGTPRDALIRDSSSPEIVGASFGYHRAMDTVGAVVGPLLAVVLLEWNVSLRSILWFAAIPGAVTLVFLGRLREARSTAAAAAAPAPARPRLRGVPLPDAYWRAVLIWTVFCIGNSSDFFLILRAQNVGLTPVLVVLAYALYNCVYSGCSWPLGALSDRVPRHLVLGGGLAVFALVYLGFAAAPAAWVVWPLFAVYGLYIAATDGVAKAWVADQLPGRKGIGTAFGIFQLTTATGTLLASVLAAFLWTRVQPGAAFVLGAGAALVALVLLALTSAHQLRALVGIGCGAAFVGFAALVARGSFTPFDQRAASHWMPGLGSDGAWRTAADAVASPAGLVPSTLVALAGVWVLVRRGARRAAAAWAAAFAVATAIAALAAALVTRPYVYEISPGHAALVGAFESSFPGGTAVRVALLAALVAAVWPRLRLPAILWAAAALVLLVLAGLHTPSDVLAALLLAASLAAAATTFPRRGRRA